MITTPSLNVSQKITLKLAILLAISFLVFALTLPAHALTITTQMGFGARGAAVSNLQAFLAEDPKVYPEGLVTGYFGSLTRAAVIRYQAKNGIPRTGFVGPITLAAISSQSFGAGIGGSDDEFAPIISLVNATTTASTVVTSGGSATQHSAVFTWVTNEESFGRVLYNTSWPFLYAHAPSVSEGTSLKTFHSVVIPGIQPNVTYYYVLESTDISGNLSYTVAKPIRTP